MLYRTTRFNCVATSRRVSVFLCTAWALVFPLSVSASDEARFANGASPPQALTTFANRILQSHPRIQAAQAELDAAHARERGAGRAFYNPEFDAEYEEGEVRTSSIGINQTIDLGGKRGARERAASFEAQSALQRSSNKSHKAE